MTRLSAMLVGTAVAVAMAAPATAQQVTLHLGHVQQSTHPMQQAAEMFAQEVEQGTGGAVRVVTYPAEQLAGLRAGAEGVQLGTIDLYIADSGTLGNWGQHFGFVSLPFLFPDYPTAIAAMAGLAPELTEAMRSDLNVERLGWSPAGFRVILSTSRAIHGAEDMRGLRIRVPEIPVYVQAFAALEANATPLPWGDVYSAMQTGVVEAVEGPPAAHTTSSHQEVASYLSRTNHIMTDLNLIMNLDRFQSLPPEHQEVLRAAGARAMEGFLTEALQLAEAEAYDQLAAALEVVEAPDSASFQSAMEPVYGAFIAEVGATAAAWIAAARGQ